MEAGVVEKCQLSLLRRPFLTTTWSSSHDAKCECATRYVRVNSYCLILILINLIVMDRLVVFLNFSDYPVGQFIYFAFSLSSRAFVFVVCPSVWDHENVISRVVCC